MPGARCTRDGSLFLLCHFFVDVLDEPINMALKFLASVGAAVTANLDRRQPFEVVTNNLTLETESVRFL